MEISGVDINSFHCHFISCRSVHFTGCCCIGLGYAVIPGKFPEEDRFAFGHDFSLTTDVEEVVSKFVGTVSSEYPGPAHYSYCYVEFGALFVVLELKASSSDNLLQYAQFFSNKKHVCTWPLCHTRKLDEFTSNLQGRETNWGDTIVTMQTPVSMVWLSNSTVWCLTLPTRWDSYASTGQKLALIKSLTTRAKRICSEDYLRDESKHLKLIFQRNGYTSQIVYRIIPHTLNSSENAQIEATNRVIIRLLWFGPASMAFKRNIMHLASTYVPQFSAICCLTSKKMFLATDKDVLPMTAFSNVIYLFTCACGHKYIGKTTQRLDNRIKQHIPEYLVNIVVSSTAPSVRCGRGRPPNQPTADTCVLEVRRGDRMKATPSSPPSIPIDNSSSRTGGGTIWLYYNKPCEIITRLLAKCL